MQIVMFLTLGLLVFPSHIVPVMGAGLLIALFLMFVARPISVLLCLAFSPLRLNERLMVSWVGLRGAVPIILATFPLLAHIPKAEMIFNVVFFIVLTSIIVQGMSIPFISKWLKVDAQVATKKVSPIAFDGLGEIDVSLEEVIVPYQSCAIGKPIFQLGVPDQCLIVLICRDEKFFIPNGKTILAEGDVLMLLANNQDISVLQKIIAS